MEPFCSRVLGYYENKVIVLKTEFLAEHLRKVLKGASSEYERLIANIGEDEKLQTHLELIFSVSPTSIQNPGMLSEIIREYYLYSPKGVAEDWDTSQIEGLMQAYSGYGSQEMSILLQILGAPETGGLGYRIKSMWGPLKRWEIDHQLRIIYLPKWYMGFMHVPDDDLGDKFFRLDNRRAAQFLKTAIHEEFLNEKSLRTDLNNKMEGALVMAGALLAIPESGGAVIVLVLIPSAVEGWTQASGVSEDGLNPMSWTFEKVGEFVAGEKGGEIGKGTYTVVSIALCLKDGVKLIGAGQTRAIAKTLDKNIAAHLRGEFKAMEDGTLKLVSGMHTKEGFAHFLKVNNAAGKPFKILDVTNFEVMNKTPNTIYRQILPGMTRLQLPRSAWANSKVFSKVSAGPIKSTKTLFSSELSEKQIIRAIKRAGKLAKHQKGAEWVGSLKKTKIILKIDPGLLEIKTAYPEWFQGSKP